MCKHHKYQVFQSVNKDRNPFHVALDNPEFLSYVIQLFPFSNYCEWSEIILPC